MRPKILATLEILLAFVLVIVLFAAIGAYLPDTGALPPLSLRSYSRYGMLLLLTGLLLVLRRRDLAVYGFSLKDWKPQLRVFGVAFLPVLAVSFALNRFAWKQVNDVLLISILEIGMLFLIAWLLRDRPSAKVGDAPGSQNLLPGLLFAPLAWSAAQGPRPGQAFLSLIYYYLFVGLAEEGFFRGYMQSRLNQAFGQPFRFFGVSWGWGLVIASLAFAAWHIVWNPANLAGWLHGLWTFFAGLIFGYVREKSRGVLAPALLHGVLNYSPFGFLFDLFGL
jgi:CAAX protease family protein